MKAIRAPFGEHGRSLSWTFVLQAFSLGTGAVTNFVLARWMGADHFGIFSYATAWLLILNIVSLVGIHDFAVKELAGLFVTKSWSRVRGLIVWSQITVLVVSAAIALGSSLVIWITAGPPNEVRHNTLLLILIILPVLSQISLVAAILRSTNKFILGQIPNAVVIPSVFVTAVAVLHLSRAGLTPVRVAGLYLLAHLVAFAVSQIFIYRGAPREIRGVAPTVTPRRWLLGSFPFMVISGLYIVNMRIDVVMLGLQRGAAEVGIFTIANRGAELALLPLTIANIILAPLISQAYASRDRSRLQRIVTQGARVSLLGTTLVSVPLLLGGSFFLGLFGDEYVDGRLTLTLLVLSNVVNVTAGPIVQVLNMTNQANFVAITFGLGVLLNALLNVILVPHFGMAGAAAATMASSVLWNVTMAVGVVKRLGINPTAFRRV